VIAVSVWCVVGTRRGREAKKRSLNTRWRGKRRTAALIPASPPPTSSSRSRRTTPARGIANFVQCATPPTPCVPYTPSSPSPRASKPVFFSSVSSSDVSKLACHPNFERGWPNRRRHANQLPLSRDTKLFFGGRGRRQPSSQRGPLGLGPRRRPARDDRRPRSDGEASAWLSPLGGDLRVTSFCLRVSPPFLPG